MFPNGEYWLPKKEIKIPTPSPGQGWSICETNQELPRNCNKVDQQQHNQNIALNNNQFWKHNKQN